MATPKNKFSMRGGTSVSQSDFSNPDLFYAPHTFWFWNGGFRTANIRKEAADFCAAGLNPGYPHARFWPTPPLDFWMSEKWVSLIADGIAEAAKHGMSCAYTIGDPCFPGKYITPIHPELNARSLNWEIVKNAGSVPQDCLFAVSGTRNKDGVLLSTSLKKHLPGAPVEPPRDLFVFRVYTDVKSQYHNSYLDHRLFDGWCEVEHNVYEKKLSGYFGRTMRGIFVDQEGDWGYRMAWSEDLAKTFANQTGYDIALALPMLIENDAEGKALKARCDWFNAIGETYADCFIRPMTKWCGDRGMYTTCHYWEGDLYQQTMMVADYMKLLRGLTMPGTDALFRSIYSKPNLFMETASVAELEDQPNMCEILAIAGWDLTTGQLKDAFSACTAWGITQPVLHGINTNPDIDNVSYAPDFYLMNPYWRMFRKYTDYSRRANFVNDQGHLDTHVLLFYPMEDAWSMIYGDVFKQESPHEPEYRTFESIEQCTELKPQATLLAKPYAQQMIDLDGTFQTIKMDMSFNHVNYLIADKHYLDGMTVKDGCLLYKDFSFRTVILPPVKVIPRSVARKLRQFADAGGQLLALGKALPVSSPEFGADDPEIKACFDGMNVTFIKPENLVGLLPPAVKFDQPSAKRILTTRRIVGERTFLWTANITEDPFRSRICVPGTSGRVEKWNCDTGSVEVLASRNTANGVELDLSLNEHEGCWLVFDPAQPAAETVPQVTLTEVMDISSDWILQIDTEKQIETCRGHIMLPDGIMAGYPMHDLKLWSEIGMADFSGVVDYRKEIELSSVSGTEILTADHIYHCAQVFVNGTLADECICAPFRFRIGKYLKPGRNEIVISVGNLIVNELNSYQDCLKRKWPRYSKPGDMPYWSGISGKIRIFR